MKKRTDTICEAIHGSGHKLVLAITGGGASLAGLLLSVPGGSRSVLEVVVPYGQQAIHEYLGLVPEKYCSAAVSRLMAERAFARGAWLAPGEPIVALGATASLVSERPKQGEHRIHASLKSDARTVDACLYLEKGRRDRESEENIAARFLLSLLVEMLGLPQPLDLNLTSADRVEKQEHPADRLAAMLSDDGVTVCVRPDGQIQIDASRPRAILPGSFDPLHEGHRRLAELAAEILGETVAYEMSLTNVDKPPLAMPVVRRRLGQFTWRSEVWLTHAPTFGEKARLFPSATFIIGADTAERIVSPRYYRDSRKKMLEALEQIGRLGCRFLVAGRRDRAGQFKGMDDISIPPELHGLFIGIARERFDMPLSSTVLRQAALSGPASLQHG